jgi:hypothetical protein
MNYRNNEKPHCSLNAKRSSPFFSRKKKINCLAHLTFQKTSKLTKCDKHMVELKVQGLLTIGCCNKTLQ